MTPMPHSCAGPPRPAGRAPARGPGFFRVACLLLLGLGLVHASLSGNRARAEARQSIQAPLAPRSLLLDATVIADGRICAVGERGHVLISSDGGRSWRQVLVPTRATLTGVAFHDGSLGWAVGHDAVILRTRDGGETWERVYADPEDHRPLLDVWFRDERNGFAIGAYGLCLRSRDGGQNWEPVFVSEDEWHLHQMARSPAGRLYIAAEAGQIYRSDDGGETWTVLPSPYDGSFFGIMPLAENDLLVYGLRGHVFRSEDAGATWRLLPTDTVATLADGLWLPDGKILLAGLAGTLLVGDPSQGDFHPLQNLGRSGVWAVVQVESNALVCFGEGGATRLSLDIP
jgi:photosystem II stability/assembly factor-like uncharacterized protein